MRQDANCMFQIEDVYDLRLFLLFSVSRIDLV